MNVRIQFRDLRCEAETKLAETVYHDILEQSFSPDELDTWEFFLDGLTPGGGYEAWGLCAMDDGEPVGCVMGYPYPESRVLLIGYVAVRSGMRSRGVGGLLMDEVQRRWYDKPGLTLVVAEIEDPRFHPKTSDVDPERRVAFYARRGAEVVTGPYFQPVLSEGKRRIYGLFLSVLAGGNGAIGPGRSVSAHQIADFLLDYFAASEEGSDWPRDDDKEGRWLLDWYRSRETVSLHPIGRYPEIEIPAVPGHPVP